MFRHMEPVEAPMNTYQSLLAKYGPVMTATQVGETLHRSDRAIWEAASRRQNPLSRAKRKVGRRVYFPTVEIASLLDNPVIEIDGGQG